MRTSARQPNTFTSFYCRTEYFQNSFLPYVVKEWNKLDPKKRSCQFQESFRKALLNVIRPSENKIFNIYGQVGIKLLTRLRLGLSHLREHKFRHNFEVTLNRGALAALRSKQRCTFSYGASFSMISKES